MTDYQPVDQPLGGSNVEAQPARRYMGGFVSLHYVIKAIARRKRVWITMALAGLLVGMSLHVVIPRKYAAQAELFLTSNPNDDPTRDMATDVALLQSEAVAGKVVDQLHLSTTAQKLTGQYMGVATTDQVLTITFNAPTSAAAVTRVNVLANKFLEFRAKLVTDQNAGVVKILQDEITRLGTPSASNQSQISSLSSQIQTDNDVKDQIIGGSSVLAGGSPIVHSALKVLLVDSASGLVAGLALGIGILALLAIASDKVRRRDEVADALGAPVELSVGRFGRSRIMRVRRLRRRLSHPGRPVELMTRQLRSVVNSDSAPKRLAVVSVDSLEPAALSVAILAGRLAVFEGKRVMVVDLSPGRVLGELLGVSTPETRIMFVKGAWVPMLVAVANDNDPMGVTTIELPQQDSGSDDTPGPSWTSPEVVLVLSSMDLGIGANHLATVADEATVVVTAGRSSAAEIRSTGELIRAAGLNLRGGILVGADKNDESVGLFKTREDARMSDGLDVIIESPPFASAHAAEHH